MIACTAFNSPYETPLGDLALAETGENKQKIRRTMLSYALIRAQIESVQDPVAALAPFLIPIANEFSDKEFSPASLRDELMERYGLAITHDVTEVFVSQLFVLRYIQKTGDGHKAVWRRQSADIPADESGIIERLIQKAQAFYENKNELLKLRFDEDLFLQGVFDIVLDQNIELQRAIRAIDETGSQGPSQISFSISNTWQFFAAAFIEHCSHSEKDIFNWISGLSGTAMIVEALVDIRTPSKQNVKPDLAVYIDAPLMMDLLGCSGYAARNDAEYIISSLKRVGISTSVYSHSIDEVQINIRAVLKREPRDRIGRTGAALANREITVRELQEILNDPTYFITEKKIPIIDTTTASGGEERFFPEERQSELYALMYSDYAHDGARERDVKSVSVTIQRRRGELRSDILKSKHIFLTRNDRLVRRIAYFCQLRLSYSPRQCIPILTAREMAGILWFLVGSEERVELSNRQLLLSCHKTRIASPEIISNMIATIATVDEASAELLWAAAQRPKHLSMALNVAFGEGDISEATVNKVLEEVKSSLVAEERRKNRERSRQMEEDHQAHVAMQGIINEKVRSENSFLVSERDILMRGMKDLSVRDFRLHDRASLVGRVCLTIFINAVLILFLYWLAVASGGPDFAGWMHAAILLTGAIVGLYGGNLIGAKWARRRLNAFLDRRYRDEIRKRAGTFYDEVVVHERIGGIV